MTRIVSTFSELNKTSSCRINFNDENVLVLEAENSMIIQYNLNNILTFSVYSFYKEQICGLCSPLLDKSTDDFKLCS